MTNQHDVHVVPNRDHTVWTVKQGGRTVSNHRTQWKAVNAAKRTARRHHVDLVTHGRDGRIRSKDSYGNERTTKDTEH